MRRLGLVLVVLVLAVSGVAQAQGPQQYGADGLGDDYFPQAGNGGYDALHYTLDLDVDLANNLIAGSVTMDAHSLHELRTLNLDFAGFEVEATFINDTLVDYDRDGNELILIPIFPVPADEDFSVRVVYSGEPGATTTEAIPIRIGWQNYGDGVYVASEPIGSQYWYPVNDHPLDKATYTFEITVDDPLVVAANGLLTDTIANGDGTTTYVWQASDPLASYLVTVNIDEFEMVTEEGPDGLLIRNFFPPDIVNEATTTFAPTADMIAFFSELFGPYPFEAYGVIVADTNFGFALETQTLSLFSRGAATGGEEVAEVIAHELAHQWFGDSVTLAEWPDIWLNEGFATYASWLWFEHTQGEEFLTGWVGHIYDYVASSSQIVPPGAAPRNDLFNAGVYIRGALTLHALREEVGDETFFAILQAYYAEYAYGNATTEDFVAVAEEVSGMDLGEFFVGWLYDTTVPDIPTMGLSAEDK